MTAGRGRKGELVGEGTIVNGAVPATTPAKRTRAPAAPAPAATIADHGATSRPKRSRRPPAEGPAAPPPTLTVGVATLDPILSWQARCIELVAAVPGVTIRSWLRSAPTAADPGTEPTGPRSTAEIPAALHGVPAIARPAAASDDAAGEAASVDILLDLTAAGVGEPGWATEVWRFGYGPGHDRRAAGSALLSYVRGSRGTPVALVREGDGGLLRAGVLQTSSWWRGELLDHFLTDVVDWPADAIRDRLATDRPVAPARPTPAAVPASRSSAILDVPGGRAVLTLGAVGRRVAGLAASMREPDWRIGVVPARIEAALRGPLPEPTWLPAPAGHFHADPFGLVRDGT
ncbi:MAG TPA: hypothetical protein VID95_04515, partial [Candidatus Limnocylindrales bacterium]